MSANNTSDKYNRIIDALETLLLEKRLTSISVSEIAQTAGIGKGSIYYYFSSKEAILEALVERSYKKPLEIASSLVDQTDVSPFTRMAIIFQACRKSSTAFSARQTEAAPQESAFLRQKYMRHLMEQLKPVLTTIIEQGIEQGFVQFERPAALAEIVLIVLTVKLDNTMAPSSPEETEDTIRGLVSLVEKGTGNPAGSLNFLMDF